MCRGGEIFPRGRGAGGYRHPLNRLTFNNYGLTPMFFDHVYPKDHKNANMEIFDSCPGEKIQPNLIGKEAFSALEC